MSKETREILDKNIEFIRESKEKAPEDNKAFMNNLEKGAEVVRAVYVLAETAKNIVDYVSKLRKEKRDTSKRNKKED